MGRLIPARRSTRSSLQSPGAELFGFLRRALGLADGVAATAREAPLELPWQRRWDRVPKRTAGHDFSRQDYRLARIRAREVARTTLGEELWERLEQDGYLDVPSGRFQGVSYRLRVGLRIEVRCEAGVKPPWRQPYLCINPTYPLPEEEFLAQLYLYVRDQEDEIIRVAAPQPWDQPLGGTF